MCVLSIDLFKRLQVGDSLLQNTKTELHTADGNKLKVFGKVNVTLKIGSCSFEQEVVVAEIDDLTGIFGMDFLESQDVEIYIGKKLLRLKGQSVSMKKRKSKTCVRINLSHDVSVPAHSELIVDSLISGSPKGEVGLIEGTNSIRNKGLLLARSLVDPRQDVIRLCLLNMNQNPIKLSQNSTIGLYNEVNSITDMDVVVGKGQKGFFASRSFKMSY